MKHNLFREVRMCFLLKGHTHEDIDRLFRRIKEIIMMRGAMTPQQLFHIIQTSMAPCDIEFVHSVSTGNILTCQSTENID